MWLKYVLFLHGMYISVCLPYIYIYIYIYINTHTPIYVYTYILQTWYVYFSVSAMSSNIAGNCSQKGIQYIVLLRMCIFMWFKINSVKEMCNIRNVVVIQGHTRLKFQHWYLILKIHDTENAMWEGRKIHKG
jgi:hypothetical protein